MSRIWKWGGTMLLGMFMMFAAPVHKANAQPGVSVSFQMFYDALSPHGQWIDDPAHGYVWTPRGVGRDFRPYYSGGRWAMTEYGNTWVSDYSWGWAPFHYGRWAYDPFYGWMWIPGTTWGPAWVAWRGGGSHYGWAPMGPGVNINISIGPRYAPPADWWVFVPCNRIYSTGGYGRYWRGSGYNNTYINNTTIINNTYVYNNNTYITGPRRGDVERVTGQRVNVYNVRNDNNPGRSRISGRQVNLYRPEIRQERNANYRPQNVVRADRGNRSDMNTQRRDNNVNAPQRARIDQGGRTNDVMSRQAPQRAEMPAARQRNDDRQVQMRTQERGNREREIRAAQQRDVQMQQQRSNREHEMRAAQQRDEQMQRQRYQANADRQQREAQRVQQQRAAEQRARQQQQIESRRQQHWENQQPRQNAVQRGGNTERMQQQRPQPAQRMERSQPQQRPQHIERRGSGESRSRR